MIPPSHSAIRAAPKVAELSAQGETLVRGAPLTARDNRVINRRVEEELKIDSSSLCSRHQSNARGELLVCVATVRTGI